MKLKVWMAPALSLAMAASSAAALAQGYGPPPPPQGYGQGYGPGYGQGDRGGWDQAPQEFRDAQRRGFHDGVEGARRDFQNHRPPSVNNRDEYRNPRFIAPPDRRDYREGFRRGYAIAVQHIYGNGYGNGNGYGPR